MAQDAIEIEREIVQQRDALESRVHEFEAKIGEVTDWRTYVRERPLVIAAGLFGAGLILAFLFVRLRSSSPTAQQMLA